MKRIITTIAFSLMISLHFASFAPAGEGYCHHCGCHDGCEKVCRLVREDKKITITCWGCKCEDFCAPGKSCEGCRHCDAVCTGCDPKVCSQPKDFVWTEWEPGCAKHIYTKKSLMRKTITKTVPGFKWVVEEVCQPCQAKCQCALIPPGANVPPPPVADARLIYGFEVANVEEAGSDVVPVLNVSSKSPSLMIKTLFGMK